MGGRAATPAPPAQAQCCCTTRQGRRCAFPALFATVCCPSVPHDPGGLRAHCCVRADHPIMLELSDP